MVWLAALAIVLGFLLAALWLVSRSPTRVRFVVSRVVRVEIEGGGVREREDPPDPTSAR